MNPLMLYVMGPDELKSRRPTEAEIAEMRRIVGEAMDLGAAGVSVSLMGEATATATSTDRRCRPTSWTSTT